MRNIARVHTPCLNSTLLDKPYIPLAPGFSKLGNNFISRFEDQSSCGPLPQVRAHPVDYALC